MIRNTVIHIDFILICSKRRVQVERDVRNRDEVQTRMCRYLCVLDMF